MNLQTASIIGAVSALVIAAVVFICLLAKNREGRLMNGFAKTIQNFFSFKYSLAEVLLKLFYVGVTSYYFITGFFTMFCKEYGNWGDHLIWDGIVLMIFYPLIVRFFFEMLMLFITLVKKVISIEAKLKDENPDNKAASIFDLDKDIVFPATTYPAGYNPYPPQAYNVPAQNYGAPVQGYAAPVAPAAPVATAVAPKIIGYDVNTGAPIYENQ